MNEQENIVKKVCKELGITYKELGEKIGVSESSLRSSVSNNKISLQIEKAIGLLLENEKLKKETENIYNLRILINNFLNNK